jgi:carbonic anhydrase/acetyltransferase-like protein (isoleucine patch superfamily)
VQVALNRSLGLHSLVVSAPIQVMNNVWIGDRVILLPGVTVGDGAVLGAGCIVTKDVPPFAVAIGNPGRVVRSRFSPDVVEALLQIAWWDWATDRIARNGEFLSADLTGMSGSDLMRLVKD